MSSGGAESSTDISFLRTFSQRSSTRVKIPKNLLNTVLEGNAYRNHISLSCNVTPGKLWGAELRGRKITRGWKRFTEENAFEFDDLLVFKYNRPSRFHVEMHRPNHGNIGNAQVMGHEGRLVKFRVTPDKIENSRMYIPQSFCEANGLHQFAGHTIYMVGDDGAKYGVKLSLQKFPGVHRLRLENGLREFYEGNDIKENDQLTMELLWDEDSTPTLKLRSKVVLVD